MIKTREGTFVRLRTTIRESREDVKFKGRLVDGNYVFTCYLEHHDPLVLLVFEVSEVCCWGEAESVLRAEISNLLGFTQDEMKRLSAGGQALSEEPHGSICIAGSKDALSKVRATAPVENIPNIQIRLVGEEDMSTTTTKHQQHYIDRLRVADTFLAFKDIADTAFLTVIEKHNNVETLPGGKRLLGESSLDCAKREFQEETGIDLSTIRYLDASGGEYCHMEGATMRVHFFYVLDD
jgi:hypothetical protein